MNAQPRPAEAIFKRMRTYANTLERTPPPVFVGRKGELDRLRAAAELVASENPRSMTRIVQGVPGSGKTSLCAEFLASVQGQRLGGGQALCAQLHPSDLDLPPLSLVGFLTETLRQGMASDAAGGVRKLVSTALQVRFDMSEYKIHNETHGLTMESNLAACIGSYAEHMWPEGAVIVLAFDEMQDCPLTDRAASTFQILNERLHSARIFVVCFGLQNTADVVREGLRLSRMSSRAVTDIGTLLPGEGRQVLEGTLDHFDMKESNEEWHRYVQGAGFAPDRPWSAWRRALIKDLEVASGDFPQHLTAALQSACLVFCRDRDAYSPDNNLLDAIADLHEKAKADYYAQRIGDELRLHETALGALARAADQGAGGVPLREALSAFEAGDDLGRSVDCGRAFDLVNLAVGRGILRQSKIDGEHRCQASSIPSITKHLRDDYDRQLARGDEIAVALANHFGFAPPASPSSHRRAC